MLKTLCPHVALALSTFSLVCSLLVGCGKPSEEPANSQVEKHTGHSNAEPNKEPSSEKLPQDSDDPSISPQQVSPPKVSQPKVSQQLRNELAKHSVFIEWSNDGWVISTSYAQDQTAALQVAAKLTPWAVIEIGEDANDEHLKLVAQQTTVKILSARFNRAITDDGIALLASLPELRELDLYQAQHVTGKGVASLAPLTNLESLKLSGIKMNEDEANVFANWKRLRILHLDDCGITDAQLAPLAELAQLKELVLDSNQLAGDGLQHLSKLNLTVLQLRDNESAMNVRFDFDTHGSHLQNQTELEVLDLSHAKLSDDGLNHLANMKSLRLLNIQHTEVEGRGFVYLANCNNLEAIELHSEAFAGVGLKHLAGCNALKALDLSWTRVGDDALEEVATLQQLTKLVLPPYGDMSVEAFWQDSHSEHLTDDGLKSVAKLKNLEWFRVSGGGITDVGMKELAALENLSHLGFGNLPNVQGACLRELSNLRKIDHLRLTNTGMTDDNLQHLAKLRNLRTVRLPKNATDAALKPLYELNKLQFVFVGDKISDEAIEKLTKAKTNVRVNRY